MNVRKSVDYGDMFAALDTLMAANLPQMERYYEIGRLVSSRPEKGAAVMAAEYLQGRYPDVSGFSPRNLRRMRAFYRTYEAVPEVLSQAMSIGWTQNVVILEAELSLQERAWYIRAANQFGWSKLELQRQIMSCAHLEMVLDFPPEVCYTEENSTETEQKNNDEDTFYLSREHMPQPNGRVRDEGPGEESWAGEPIPHRIRRHQHRGDRQSGLSPGPPQAGRAWHRLRRQNGTPVEERGLRPLRPPDWDGQSQSSEHAPHLRRRFRRQTSSADGVCGPPRCRGRRPLVYG